MSKALRGNEDATGLRIAIVVSRFSIFIAMKMLAGAREALISHGAKAGEWIMGRSLMSYRDNTRTAMAGWKSPAAAGELQIETSN